jgi:hypothetical protein
MVLCGKCEFSRILKDNSHLPRLEYECFADIPVYGSSIVMGVKSCSTFHKKIDNLEISIKPFSELPEFNPTSLTICANIGTYLVDLEIDDIIDHPELRWIDMMCNSGKALKEYVESGKQYNYVVGIEPHGDRQDPFEYHRIYVGDPSKIQVRPKPNLITSRYGFYYAKVADKMRYLAAWFDLLKKNGVMVIYPYFTKTSPDTEKLDRYIDKNFKNVERKKIKKDLVRLRIVK